jgi:ATP-binding cassette subfamily B (MDR/TAP) protein 1
MSATDQGQPPSKHHSLQDHKQRGWGALFAFTRRSHLLVLVPAILLSLVAGLLLPVTAIFFGRVFNNFSDYAAGKIEVTIFTREITGNIYALLVLGVATFVLKGGLFNFWLQFGEMQARCIREELFRTLLEKDLEWYDLRTSGVETLLTRTQT